MQIIETTAHVGNDGVLRLEVPTQQRNQDIKIALVMESAQPAALMQTVQLQTAQVQVVPAKPTRGSGFEDLIATLLPEAPSSKRL